VWEFEKIEELNLPDEEQKISYQVVETNSKKVGDKDELGSIAQQYGEGSQTWMDMDIS